jgi:ribosomal protein S18 acetylase RimI-like enzyme
MTEIRTLSVDDWDLWRVVRLAALADSPDAFGDTLTDWVDAPERQWRERLATTPFRAVAFEDQVPVGQVAAFAPDAEGGVKLIAMWVTPEARGRKVADALITSVVDWARSMDATVVYLYVWPSNAVAKRAYERFGFTHSALRISPIRAEVQGYDLPLR